LIRRRGVISLDELQRVDQAIRISLHLLHD
jgi:hypothetical protein